MIGKILKSFGNTVIYQTIMYILQALLRVFGYCREVQHG